MILITGGAGYIGSHVNKVLHKKGRKTLIFDNLINGHREFVKWGDLIVGDLKNINEIKKVLKMYRVKAVMHFAAYAYVAESLVEPEKYYFNNMVNTINLLSAMKEYNVNNFIFSSSCTTYGIPSEIPITETHPRNPINPYGRSKYMIEEILSDYANAYGLKYVSLRYFNAAGADVDGEIGERHNPETHLIPLILDVALGKRAHLKIYGSDYNTPDGTCIRDYVHVTDLALAHVLALDYLLNAKKCEVFNVGCDQGYSVKEVIRIGEQVTGTKINVREAPRREGDSPILISSSEKIRRILCWKPTYGNLLSIMESAWKWHKKDTSL